MLRAVTKRTPLLVPPKAVSPGLRKLPLIGLTPAAISELAISAADFHGADGAGAEGRGIDELAAGTKIGAADDLGITQRGRRHILDDSVADDRRRPTHCRKTTVPIIVDP